jgi:hypothetical protein
MSTHVSETPTASRAPGVVSSVGGGGGGLVVGLLMFACVLGFAPHAMSGSWLYSAAFLFLLQQVRVRLWCIRCVALLHDLGFCCVHVV